MTSPTAATGQTGSTLDLTLRAEVDVIAYRLGRGGALEPTVAETVSATASGKTVRWLLPLVPNLVYQLDGLTSLAFETGAEPLLVLPDALPDSDQFAAPLEGDDRLFAWDFVEYRMLGEDAGRLSANRLAYYRKLAGWLLEGEGAEPVFAKDALVPTDGNSGKQGGLKAMAADLADVATAGVLGHALATISPGPVEGTNPSFEQALLIGAYGGEHTGDDAILGGVLFRIHQRHGVKRAILMTQRPAHTRHLVKMLETPVEVEVQEYTLTNIRKALPACDGLVFAGGPLTDLPKQLVRHLFAASLFKRVKKPFVMEGIGPGAFPRKPSEITARRLVKLADRISIRTKDDETRPIIRGRKVEVGHDPAFDYLATRGETLTRLPDVEPAQIEELLADTAGRPVIGLNIWPIGHLYTPDAPGRDKAAYTYEVEQSFEKEFAQGLAEFSGAATVKPVFVFFPMNAIQFGMSDLRSAHRIVKHLPPEVDFRLWEADASLDGVVALLRRLDAAVTMRFHATIFALSQQCPVAGIDYRIGIRDKVAAVLDDAGRNTDYCRIDELTGPWLAAKLGELLSRPRA